MTIDTAQLLERLSETLRSEIGPAVGDEYTRTQAYMASVILARVAKQVALAPGHRAAEREDLDRLHHDLAPVLAGAPAEVALAATEARSGAIAGLGPLIRSIYAWGTDHPDAAQALAMIRIVLRHDIDRRMEIAT